MNLTSFLQKPHRKIYFVGFLIILLSCLNLAFLDNEELINSYAIKQFFWFLLSIITAFLISRIRLQSIKALAVPLYLFSILLLIIVLFGEKISGARSWIKLFGFSFQPSELVKISYVFMIAKLYSDLGSYSKSLAIKYFLGLLFFVIPFILIMIQPDFGSAFMLLLLSMAVIFSFSFNKKFLFFLLLITFAISIPVWQNYLKPYQKQRIINFINPENDPRGYGYNAIQSKISIGSGSIIGKGFGNSSQSKFGFLPEKHTDFAFSVWAEQTGFLGSLILSSLYLFLIIYPLLFLSSIKDIFLKVIIFGISSYFFFHFVVNSLMTIGLFPVIGIPMILFSYGGTSLLCSSIAFSVSALIISEFRDYNRLGV